MQPPAWCYCNQIQSFDCGITFVILQHPLERRRRIASGRMAHLLLKNSHLIIGHNYSNDVRVDALIADPSNHCAILHLDRNSTNLNSMSEAEKKSFCPFNKRLVIFAVDGTWGTASKTVRLSKNLRNLPKISFTPNAPSMFRVRRQPTPMCYSTLEAIHQTIDLLGNSQGFNVQTRRHDKLLDVFHDFVTKQVDYLQELKARTGTLHYRQKLNRTKSMSVL